MLNLYKVKVYKKEKIEDINVVNFLDSVVVNVLPEDFIFNKTREIYTGKSISIVESMDSEEFKEDENIDVLVFKNEFKDDNKIKANDKIMKYYFDNMEDSSFNRYISADKVEKVLKKEVSGNE